MRSFDSSKPSHQVGAINIPISQMMKSRYWEIIQSFIAGSLLIRDSKQTVWMEGLPLCILLPLPHLQRFPLCRLPNAWLQFWQISWVGPSPVFVEPRQKHKWKAHIPNVFHFYSYKQSHQLLNKYVLSLHPDKYTFLTVWSNLEF